MITTIRGAITVERNDEADILDSVSLMLRKIIEMNELEHDEVIAMLFTATRDLDAVYPAKAARNLGFNEISLMCMQEMYVQGSLPRCIRVMVLCDRKKNGEPRHAYLREARNLRPDLLEKS